MIKFFNPFLNFLFSGRCLICEKDFESNQRICEVCLSNIKYISSPICTRCGVPFDSEIGRDHLCGTCLISEVYFARARAVGIYEGVLQEAVHLLKYKGRTLLAKPLGGILANCNLDSVDFKSYDFLIPVPLHRKRLRERGFNQALSLARCLGRKSEVTIDYISLRRVRWEGPQINLSKKDRERNVRGAFLCNEDRVKGGNVLLVDDVYTSGATVNECAKVLLNAGAARVDVFTLCRAI